jgi:hypothetical protein
MVCCALGAAACGAAPAQRLGLPTPVTTPLPGPSNVRPLPAGQATAAQARTLLRQARFLEYTTVSARRDQLSSWSLTRGDSRKHWMSGLTTEQSAHDTWRTSVFVTHGNSTSTSGSEIVVHGIKYERSPGEDRWQCLGPVQDLPAGQWAAEELAVARTIGVVATADIDGVRCIGVRVDIDVPHAFRAYPSSDLFYLALQDLSATKQQATAWAATARETDVVWIGRSDHLVYAQIDDYSARAGKLGVLRCHEADLLTVVGKKIVPPIVVPSPAYTPSQSA